MPEVEFLVVGCGPAGGMAAREAAREGSRRSCSSATPGRRRSASAPPGLRPGFCEDFDVPRAIVHFDAPGHRAPRRQRKRYDFPVGPAHTTTREELDGTIAELARGGGRGDPHVARCFVARADRRRRRRGVCRRHSGERRTVTARHLFMAQRLERAVRGRVRSRTRRGATGCITCTNTACIPERRAAAAAYHTLEMHYYRIAHSGRNDHRMDVPEARSPLDRSRHHGPRSTARSCGPNSIGFCRACSAACFRRRRTPCAKKATCSTAGARGRRSRTIA